MTLVGLSLSWTPSFAQTLDSFQLIGQRMSNGAYEGITGVMLSIDGNLLLETYAPGNDDQKRHDIRSATKSITALLIGELIEDGHLKAVDQRVAEILPGEFESIPADDPKRRITVEDLLTMRSGLACNDWVPSSVGHEDKMYQTQDWIAFLIGQPLAHEVGEHFSYCTGGVVLLGRMIEELSGRSVPDLAQERIFGPLGIQDAEWATTPQGYTDTGGHLRSRLADLHKIGLLVAGQGSVGSDRIVSQEWISAITREHTRIYERRERYGYLWWLDSRNVKGHVVDLIYAHGNGGTFIVFVPQVNLVAAFTGENYGEPEQFIPLQLLSRELIPALID